MQTGKMSNIEIETAKLPSARHNLSHDVNTTSGIGDVQPLMCQVMVPNSSASVNMESLIRSSPLVAAPFARMSQKFYNIFVPFSDLSQNFAHLMAQEPVSRSGGSFVPQTVPHIKLKYLSALVLIGAKCTYYSSTLNGSAADNDDVSSDILFQISSYRTDDQAPEMSSQSNGLKAVYADMFGSFPLPFNANKSSFASLGLNPCMQFRLKSVFPELMSSETTIPLSNDSPASFFHIDPDSKYAKRAGLYSDLVDVPLAKPDIMLPLVSDKIDYVASGHACFRLSSFGKAIKKCIQACGYAVNFADDTEVDFFALLAVWKAYFQIFAPKRYKSYETSFAYKLQWFCDQAIGNPDLNLLFDDDRDNDFWHFILDLGQMYYTDEVDFISAHTRSTSISPDAQGFINLVNTDITSSGSPNMYQNDSSSEPVNPAFSGSGHAMINNTIHGQLDSELLMKLYAWTNVNTVAGRRVEELLRAQGLGAWVDSHKSHFIGYNDVPLPITEIISQSDTYSKVDGQSIGMALGERAGKSEAYDKGKTFKYNTEEFGYWVTLYTIVPKAGYCEQLDQTLTAISKFQFYNPKFDGLGMEFSRKSAVHGSMHIADFTNSSGKLSESFGLISRYAHWKVARNLLNGDFNVGGVQDSYLSYCLDRIIAVGERLAVETDNPTTSSDAGFYKFYNYYKTFKPSDVPIAGDSWRFLTMYPFIGKFDRMFLANPDIPLLGTMNSAIGAIGLNDWFLFHNAYDHFICQMIVDMPYWACMLPLERSFETTDQGNDGKAHNSMSKA